MTDTDPRLATDDPFALAQHAIRERFHTEHSLTRPEAKHLAHQAALALADAGLLRQPTEPTPRTAAEGALVFWEKMRDASPPGLQDRVEAERMVTRFTAIVEAEQETRRGR